MASAPSCSNGACVVLMCCDGCPASVARQLAAELRRLPEDAAGTCNADHGTMHPIVVKNKYFTVHVQTRIVSASDISGQNDLSGSSTGYVLLVSSSTCVDSVPWHYVPATSLFRVLMDFSNADTLKEAFCDACVINRFEYCCHRDAYETLPDGIEGYGLLRGKLAGAARLTQILYNTMWSEGSHTPVSDSDCGCGVADKNRVAVIGSYGEGLMQWLAASSTESIGDLSVPSRLTAFCPSSFVSKAGRNKQSDEDYLQRLNKNTNAPLVHSANGAMGANMVVANSQYASILEVQYIHAAMFSPAMTDLFMIKYGRYHPQLVVVCYHSPCLWREGTDALSGEADEWKQISLPLVIEQVRKWTSDKILVVVIGERNEEETCVLSHDMSYCEQTGIETIFVTRGAPGGSYSPGSSADHLNEIIHSINWPEQQQMLLRENKSVLTERKANRLLFWAAATNSVEEEFILPPLLETVECKPVPNVRSESVLPLPPTLMQSAGDQPVGSALVRNKYFEASLDIHCCGGMREFVVRSPQLTAEQLRCFGVVIIVTTSKCCEMEYSGRLLSVLKVCCDAIPAFQDDDDLYLEPSCGGEPNDTSALGAAAESSQDLVLYIMDGDEANDALAQSVEKLLQQLSSQSKFYTNHLSLCESDEDGDCGKGPRGGLSNADSLNGSDDGCYSINGDLAPLFPPVEVVYGSGSESGLARLKEVMVQHVWPERKMAKESGVVASRADATRSDHLVPMNKETAATLSVADAADGCGYEIHIGCELPPNYLVNPETKRSVRVAALDEGELSDECQKELIHWIEMMKCQGHHLPHRVRDRQAEVLSKRLGLVLGA
uniref:Uncharacterized protein TCIL3000_11_6180 n=1 Tax=Trypanosoma congolense (strain IL3000) TaxID=1068625 RepID=G0V0M4_TRYCI|nr:unnamed protein product [Trypanosoma congolense IL3000]